MSNELTGALRDQNVGDYAQLDLFEVSECVSSHRISPKIYTKDDLGQLWFRLSDDNVDELENRYKFVMIGRHIIEGDHKSPKEYRVHFMWTLLQQSHSNEATVDRGWAELERMASDNYIEKMAYC